MRPAAGSEFDDVIGFGQQIEVMFDHNDAMALLDEIVQHANELFAVTQMKPDGGLFEQVEIAHGEIMRAFAKAWQALR